MATTQKGIYYPDDYTAVADVPEDMKKLAESVDTVIGDSESTTQQAISTLQGQVSDIQDEQTTQNNEITALQTENARLKATLPTTTGSGENITLSKTAELEFIQPPLPRGNSEQVQYSGKNLFDKNTDIVNSKSFTNTGELVDLASAFVQEKYIPVKSSTAYTLATTNSYVGSSGDYRLVICEYDENKNFIQRILVYQQKYNTVTTTANTKFVRICASKVTIDELQLEQSSTQTSYEPYVGGTASPNPSYPQPITNVTGDVEVLVQNKNLVDYNKFVTNLEHTITDNELIVNFTGTFQDGGTQDIKIDNKKYIVSYEKEVTGTDTARLELRLLKDNVIIDTRVVSTTSIIDNENGLYDTARITLSNRQTTLGQVIFKNIILEQGTTATTYTPHKEQTFTFPLGNQRMYLGDYLADDGIHHVRKQVVWNGTESWFLNQEKTNSILFSLSISDMVNIGNVMGLDIKSNYFTPGNAYALDKELIEQISRSLYINIDKSRLNNADLAGFKTWLSTHNVTVEYELEQEEITPYTTEQQQAYDEIKQAISYEEQTNISGSSDESNPLFSVEAYQSMKLVLQEISNAVVALGGV